MNILKSHSQKHGIEIVDTISDQSSLTPFDPTISHAPIAEVVIVHVLEQDLDNLQEKSSDETEGFGFFCASLGVLCSCGLGWLGVPDNKPLAVMILAGLTGCFVLLTLFFGRNWWKTRKKRVEALRAIKASRRTKQISL